MGDQVKQNIDQNKIQEFMNKAIGDIASSSSTMLIILGERLTLQGLIFTKNQFKEQMNLQKERI